MHLAAAAPETTLLIDGLKCYALWGCHNRQAPLSAPEQGNTLQHVMGVNLSPSTTNGQRPHCHTQLQESDLSGSQEAPALMKPRPDERSRLMNINTPHQDTDYWPKGSEVQQTVEGQAAQVATRSEKSEYRYSDFYCFLSLADFTAYVSRDDADGESGFSISGSSDPAL